MNINDEIVEIKTPKFKQKTAEKDKEIEIIKDKINKVNIYLHQNNYPLIIIPSFIQSHPKYLDYGGYFYREY